MDKRAHVFFSGRVQGVFFRAHTEKKALSLGLHGWVRNLPDKRVEAVFEGPHHLVEEAIAYCSNQQPPARVDNTDVEWEDALGEQGFKIQR